MTDTSTPCRCDISNSALRQPTPPIWVLVSVTFSGTLAMHMFVPALPDAARTLGASQAGIQLSISLYVLGLGLGQLVYGPLSDGLGRRPTLLSGLALYAVGGALAAFAASIETLLGARLMQAVGGCAGLLLSRAIVRDTSSTEDGVRCLALITVMAVVGPGLGPLLGASVVSAWGWRSLLVGLSLLGLFNLLLTWRWIPETGHPTGQVNIAAMRRDYQRLLRNRRYVGYAIAGGCATTSFYGFIAAAPFVFSVQLGRPLRDVGFYLAGLMLGVAVGNALAGSLARVVRLELSMVLANALSGLCATTLFVLALLGYLDALVIGGLMFIYAIGVGACAPAVSMKTLSVDPKAVGSAAGLSGCAQMLIGAACTALAGVGSNAAISAFSVLLFGALMSQLAFWLCLHLEAKNPSRKH